MNDDDYRRVVADVQGQAVEADRDTTIRDLRRALASSAGVIANQRDTIASLQRSAALDLQVDALRRELTDITAIVDRHTIELKELATSREGFRVRLDRVERTQADRERRMQEIAAEVRP